MNNLELHAWHVVWHPCIGPGFWVTHALVLSVNQGKALLATPGPRVLASTALFDVPQGVIQPHQTTLVQLWQNPPPEVSVTPLGVGVLHSLFGLQVKIVRNVMADGSAIGYATPNGLIPGSVKVALLILDMNNIATAATIGKEVSCDLTPEIPYLSTCLFRAYNIHFCPNEKEMEEEHKQDDKDQTAEN